MYTSFTAISSFEVKKNFMAAVFKSLFTKVKPTHMWTLNCSVRVLQVSVLDSSTPTCWRILVFGNQTMSYFRWVGDQSV